MANLNLINRDGKKSHLYRAYTANASLSSTQYLPPSQFQMAKDQATPNEGDTELTTPIPISDGTANDDGANTLTGSSGGDNSTDNTTTYKEGAGLSDDTAQNLIANDTSVTKIWTISNLASLGTNIVDTQPFGKWFYIKDQTALDKFVTSGTALEIKLGSDSSNYYSYTREASDLVQGWNWITSNRVAVGSLTETGTVSGDIDTFIIEITTNNATDEFVAGDVIYDLLRQWEESDLYKDFILGYPTIDLTNLEVSMKCFLTATEMNGFDTNGVATFNKDTSILMTTEGTFEEDSKSGTDQFIITIKNREI